MEGGRDGPLPRSSILSAMHSPAIEFLKDYVAIPSVNPMGRDDIPAELTGEARYAEHLAAQLRRIGLDVELLGGDDRPSVIAEARSTDAVDTLMVDDGQ